MLPCLKPSRPRSANSYISSPTSQGDTPSSSVQLSPTVNLSREYTLAIHAHSYSEIRSAFQQDGYIIGHVDVFDGPQILEQILRPSHDSVQETLSLVKPDSFTYLVSTYFEHSETASRLCFLLYKNIHHARLIYTPISTLLDDLPMEFNLTLSQCNSAFDVFLRFESLENPFLSPNSNNFNDVRQCFSHLKQNLDHHLGKSRSRVNRIRYCKNGSALCLIAAVFGVAISAVAIATHSLVALVAGPVCPAVLMPSSMTEKEMVHLAQLNAASKGVYVLSNDLDTIDRLVVRLHAAIENDRHLVRMGLERDVDRYTIEEILKQLRRNRPGFVQQLVDLEEHLFLCFAAINRARTLLLGEIRMHQNSI